MSALADAYANAQRVTELEAELAHTAPVAAAAPAYCAARESIIGRPIPADGDEIPPGYFDAEDALRDAKAALLAAHRATTPSPVPSSHVIVERARLERLEAIEKAARALVDGEPEEDADNIEDLTLILDGV